MLLTKTNEIDEQVASMLKYHPNVVKDVMEHVYLSTKNYLVYPDSAGMRLPHLGTIRPNYKALNHFLLKKLIPRIRKERSEELINRFRIYWELRKLIRNDKQRRKYKERFGSWHYK